MNRKFITNLAILLFLNLLIKPFWILGIDRSVQNTVGAESYGFYFAVFNFTFLFNILLDLGLTNFNNRNIAQNEQLLQKHVSSLLVLKFLLAAGYTLVTLSAGLIIGYNTPQMLLLLVLCFNQFLISLILYLRSNISGMQSFKTDSLISVLDRAIMIAICSVLLWGHISSKPFRIEWFVFAQTFSYLFTAAVALIIVFRKAHFQRLRWNRLFFLMILRKSFPFAVLVLLMAFYNRIDSVMIERLLPGSLGDFQAGIYASAFRLLDATNMIAFLFAVILLPLFARMIKQNQDVKDLVRLSFTLLFVFSVLVAASSFVYRQPLMSLLYPPHISEPADIYTNRLEQISQIFGILMFGFIPISTTYVFGTLLTANGNLKQLNIMAATGMVTNLILNFILIPNFLATGSAVASIITQILTAAVQVVLTILIFRFSLNIVYLMKLLLFLAVTVTVSVLCLIYFSNFVTGIPIIVITGFLVAAVTKLINFSSLLTFLKAQKS